MRKNNCKKEYGFSLIETLIAVSILMIAIAGPLSLVQAGLFSSNHQRNQVTAMYLAQEAIEYIKSLRDANFYKNYTDSTKWLLGPVGPDGAVPLADTGLCGGTYGCYVDPHGKLPGGAFVQSVSSGSSMNLKRNVSNGAFSYGYDDSDVVTPYKRTVKISTVSPDEVTVSVVVDWKDGTLPRSYAVNTNLFNYQIAEPGAAIISGGGGDTSGGVVGYMHHHTDNIDGDVGYGDCGGKVAFVVGQTSFQPDIPFVPGQHCNLSSVEISSIPDGYSVKVLPDGPTFTSSGNYNLTESNPSYNDLGSGVSVAPLSPSPIICIPPQVPNPEGTACVAGSVTALLSIGDYPYDAPGGGCRSIILDCSAPGIPADQHPDWHFCVIYDNGVPVTNYAIGNPSPWTPDTSTWGSQTHTYVAKIFAPDDWDFVGSPVAVTNTVGPIGSNYPDLKDWGCPPIGQ